VTDDQDPLDAIASLGDVFDTAVDEVLKGAQDRMNDEINVLSNAWYEATGQLAPDELLANFHKLEWRLLHIANIATVLNLARRRMLAHPDKIAEIAGEARDLVNWNRRLAADAPDFMPMHLIPRIGMHPDPDGTWANMVANMNTRRMREDDGPGDR
jgi:hypothetical protein